MPRKRQQQIAPPVITRSEGELQMETVLPPTRRVTKRERASEPTLTTGPQRLPRITRLMALAIQVQGQIDRREIRDYAEVARVGYVTRARMTQIMNLLNLAPDIQESILFMDCSPNSALAEGNIRMLCTEVNWDNQRRLFSVVLIDDRNVLQRTLSKGNFTATLCSPEPPGVLHSGVA